jgi:predicted nucleic acid-binding Zn ribbon protein
MPPAPLHCRLCSAPLTRLQQMRADVCSTARCRLVAARERARRRRDDELAQRRAAAAALWRDDAVPLVPVVWIERHETRLVPLPAALRRDQAAHLRRLAHQLAQAPRDAAAAPPPPACTEPPPCDTTPLAPALCTFCAGRCCRHGAGTHGFVTAELLQRWLRRHPQATPADAAAAYLQRLPRHHVQGSCPHHGRSGCTLPREMRSDICNGYACDALRRLQDHPEYAAVVAAMDRAETLGPVALLRREGHRVLPQRSGRAKGRN